MSEQSSIIQAAADWLAGRGIPARPGWSGRERERLDGPVVLVGVKRYAAAPGGFENYLGERYNEETSAWEEFYGKKVDLSLGLDLYAPESCSEGELQTLLEQVVSVLTLGAPDGLQVGEVTCGGTVWDETQRCLKRETVARCTAWLQAAWSQGEEFLDFELRGGWKI